MARSLVWLWRQAAYHEADRHKWIDVPNTAPTWLLRSNQLASLRWWGLIERQPNDNPEVKHNGMWRLTNLGYGFVRNQTRVSDKVFVYDAEVVGMSERPVLISECFGKKFSYQEVMSSRHDWGR
jgi:hypothetical protein